MPKALIHRITVCLLIAIPAVVLRVTGLELAPVAELPIYGAAVVAAAFLLAWAAEAARKDISGTLAIALLALVAVLPELAVDLYYSFRSGSDPTYTHYAAANMTGSNRLLLGLGWPLVVAVALLVTRRRNTPRSAMPRQIRLPRELRLDIGFLATLALIGFAVPIAGNISLWLSAALLLIFALYMHRASQMPDDEHEDFVGAAALIADMPQRGRRATLVLMFVVAAAVIVSSAEPFAEALVASGAALGIDGYFLVQWLAPLASEAPEFIVAVLFAIRGNTAAAIGTLMAAKINQWSLLVGSLPVAHFLGGGSTALPLDARQISDFVLTGTMVVLGVTIIMTLRLNWWSALVLVSLYAAQFVVTDVGGRYVLSGAHIAVALVFAYVHRDHLLPTLAAPWRNVRSPSATMPAYSGEARPD